MLCHRTSREVVDTVCGMVIKGDKAGGDDADTCPLKVLPGIHRCMLLLLGPTVGCYCCSDNGDSGVSKFIGLGNFYHFP